MNPEEIESDRKDRGQGEAPTSTGHTHDGDDHGHGHEHPAAPMVEEITDYEILEIAVRELAIEHGLFTAEDHRRFTEWAESIGPIAGSRLVAKAWTDPAFKARALKDAVKTCKEGLGLDWAEPTGFGTPSDYTGRVLEDTPTLHHVIVRTLCSCYPRPMLGMSPEWYRTTNYRRRMVRWPREVLAEVGLMLPPEVEIAVEESNQKCRFMVLPVRPDGTENWTEEQLAAIVTRTIGRRLPQPGKTADVHPIHKARRPSKARNPKGPRNEAEKRRRPRPDHTPRGHTARRQGVGCPCATLRCHQSESAVENESGRFVRVARDQRRASHPRPAQSRGRACTRRL